jgi:hypothetical protein
METWVELEDARTAGRGSLAALAVNCFEGPRLPTVTSLERLP